MKLAMNHDLGTDRLWNRIYATPSNILRSSGSVGVSLIMWLVGALIAACGTMVYIELGTVCLFFCWIQYLDLAHISIKGLPRSGGEKNYLEYIYRRPKFLVTCIFTTYTLIMASRLHADFAAIFIHLWQGMSTPNSVVFSECTHFNLFNPCLSIYLYPRSASFSIYRANMAQYATCCLYLSDFDMPCPWYLFEIGSPFAKHFWCFETPCTCCNSCVWLFISRWCKGHPSWRWVWEA